MNLVVDLIEKKPIFTFMIKQVIIFTTHTLRTIQFHALTLSYPKGILLLTIKITKNEKIKKKLKRCCSVLLYVYNSNLI